MSRKTLLIGLGQIGMGYDASSDPTRFVLTHARAFSQHPAFELVGGVDPDPEKRKKFEMAFAKPAFFNLGEALETTRPDIVVVATPTQTHLEIVQAILKNHKLRAILCEKPLAYSLKDAEEIQQLCQSKSCDLYVNYMRGSEPGAGVEIPKLLQPILIGKNSVKGVVWYTKGLYNNGSHFLNLLQKWLGPVVRSEALSEGRKWGGIDPEPDAVFEFSCGSVYFLAAREEDYSHYSIELVTANGRLRYDREGHEISWQPKVADPVYSGYHTLSEGIERIENDLNRCLWHVADQLALAIDGKPASICDGKAALDTLRELAKIAKVQL